MNRERIEAFCGAREIYIALAKLFASGGENQSECTNAFSTASFSQNT